MPKARGEIPGHSTRLVEYFAPTDAQTERAVQARKTELAHIIVAVCALIDHLLAGATGASLPGFLKMTKATVDRMREYLDRRDETAETPGWVARMRVTVRKADERSVGAVDDNVFEVK